jgi:hypothetical protein
MKSLKTAPAAQNPIRDVEVYKDFMRLNREHRRRMAMRILHNQRLLADLYDHFLIQHSMHEPGQSVPWETYARENAAGF